jgi:hypothetical protein
MSYEDRIFERNTLKKKSKGVIQRTKSLFLRTDSEKVMAVVEKVF